MLSEPDDAARRPGRSRPQQPLPPAAAPLARSPTATLRGRLSRATCHLAGQLPGRPLLEDFWPACQSARGPGRLGSWVCAAPGRQQRSPHPAPRRRHARTALPQLLRPWFELHTPRWSQLASCPPRGRWPPGCASGCLWDAYLLGSQAAAESSGPAAAPAPAAHLVPARPAGAAAQCPGRSAVEACRAEHTVVWRHSQATRFERCAAGQEVARLRHGRHPTPQGSPSHPSHVNCRSRQGQRLGPPPPTRAPRAPASPPASDRRQGTSKCVWRGGAAARTHHAACIATLQHFH